MDAGSDTGVEPDVGAGPDAGDASDGAVGSDGDAGAVSDADSSAGDATVSDAQPADAGTDSSALEPPYEAFDASDLAPPNADAGVQLAPPDGSIVVQPNQEIFPCTYATLPAAINVGGFESWMSPVNAVEVRLFQNTGPAQPDAGGSCAVPGNLLLDAMNPGQVVQIHFPAGVAFSLAAGTQLVVQMHFVNTGTTAVYPQVKVNLLYAGQTQYETGTLVAFNTGINVPAATAQSPGTQTVSGTCTAASGSNFFLLTTRTFGHATAASMAYVHGASPQTVVSTGDAGPPPADEQPGTGTVWTNPGVGVWNAPAFLAIGAGDSLTYQCSYTNSSNAAVTVGGDTSPNDECMAFGYYFPARTVTCN